MNKASEYFYNNVIIAVEVEYAEGGRQWFYVKGEDEEQKLIESVTEAGDYLSDSDFSSNQPDKFVKRVIDLAHLNWFKNDAWCKRNNLTSYWKVIDFILENELYKAS
jgi:hypothetical protein